MATEKSYSSFEAEDILQAWLAALQEGAGPDIVVQGVDPNGLVATLLRRRIEARLKESRFDRAAHTASTTVARDLGRICRVIGEASPDRTVTEDAFQKIVELRQIHPACPPPDAGGAGPFC